MEPDFDQLLEKLKTANENLSQAFIKQSLAWNQVSAALRELRENQPNLFSERLAEFNDQSRMTVRATEDKDH